MSKVWGALVVVVVVIVSAGVNDSWGAIAVGSIVCGVFIAFAKGARKSERSDEQSRKDEAAQKLLAQLEESNNHDAEQV